ncbi:hypothetical protein [Ramlibacter sp. WS9]|uniref:hypothetical protein n=1 Tax=Ramlibacter sp. WS9 TaxID=1882741 RepID=UPI00114385FF|nr:hypothetical protein [Ramlibacter sp. WS9]ROZ71219.1 hypothetical protein EEB15_21470 [Ramlibacter sp. WS9]
MKKLLPLIACLVLGACSGIPLASVPRILALKADLLEANPAEIMLAIQVDERIAPARGDVPVLHIDIRPREVGAFAPWEGKMPMRLSAGAAPKGLQPAARGRHWLVYSLGPESQAELLRTRARFQQLQAERRGKSGGSVSVGIAQEGVAAASPHVAGSVWESWLQTSAQAGFFKLWSGTLDDLRAQARAGSP